MRSLVFSLAVLSLTFLTYHYTLRNQFTNWDDSLYVRDNPYIKNITGPNLKILLTHNVTNNYYHPLTMLSLAVNYHFAKMEPEQYYFTNVLLHSLNAALMFLLVLMLLSAMEEAGYGTFHHKLWFATFAALCFGLHPMHVESVSWLSERKDVLYGFFYFLALVAYIRYLSVNKPAWLVFALFLFICSLLSKPLAVSFGLALIGIDIILRRDKKVSFRRIALEKAPFLLVALGGGLWTWYAQKVSGSIPSVQVFTFTQRLVFSAYSFGMYMVKAFVPLHLCSFYPYPPLNAAGYLPAGFYVIPLAVPLMVFAFLYFSYKASEYYFRIVLGGLVFYFFNVMFVLQFITSGHAIMADRYCYIAYFGIFVIIIYSIYLVEQKYTAGRSIILATGGAFLLALGIICYERTTIWHNTQTLWEDVIAQYPYRVSTSYKNLGNYYAEQGESEHNLGIRNRFFDSAENNYKILEDSFHLRDASVYTNLANIYAERKQYVPAVTSYSKALELDSANFETHLDRGIVYSLTGDYTRAMDDFNKAYKRNPNSELLLKNRAIAYMFLKEYGNAIDDLNKLIAINPNIPEYWLDRGKTECNRGQLQQALNDFNNTISLRPGGSLTPECYYDISYAYKMAGQYKPALSYALKAKESGYLVPDSYLLELKSRSSY